jgi:hypothetical protein
MSVRMNDGSVFEFHKTSKGLAALDPQLEIWAEAWRMTQQAYALCGFDLEKEFKTKVEELFTQRRCLSEKGRLIAMPNPGEFPDQAALAHNLLFSFVRAAYRSLVKHCVNGPDGDANYSWQRGEDHLIFDGHAKTVKRTEDQVPGADDDDDDDNENEEIEEFPAITCA